jgi:hypothetical protein
LKKIKDVGFINMDAHAEPLDVGDYPMMDVQYMSGLSKLLNIRSQLSN